MLKKNNIIFYIILYKLTLDLTYIFTYNKIYEYAKFYIDFNIFKIIFSCFMTIYFAKIILKYNAYIEFIFFIFTIIPLYSLFGLMNLSLKYTIMYSFSFYIILFIAKIEKRKKNFTSNKKYKKKLFLYFLLFTVLVCSFLFINKYGMFDLRALNLFNVYSIRKERVYSKFYSYLLSFTTTSFIPLLMLFSLKLKEKKYLCLCILLEIYFYMYTGVKFYLFSLIFFTLIYTSYIYKIYFFKIWTLIFIFLNIISNLEYYILKKNVIISLFPGRTLFDPARISYLHYMFFNKFPKLYYSESLLGKVLNIMSPYEKYSGFIISDYFLKGTKGNYATSNFNSGFLAVAYDNLGFMGMIIESILIGMILRYLYKICNEKNRGIVLTVGAFFLLMLNNGSLLQILLSGGIIFDLLFLTLYCYLFDNV